MGRKAMNKILIKNAHLISMDDNIGDLLDTDILINETVITGLWFGKGVFLYLKNII